jgi:hypothetical protein
MHNARSHCASPLGEPSITHLAASAGVIDPARAPARLPETQRADEWNSGRTARDRLTGAFAPLAAGYRATINCYEGLGRRAPLRFAMFTVAMLFALVFSIFEPGFDTNDDAVMNMIVAGKGYGLSPDEHIVFSNVLVGFVLARLYSLWPSVPWYGSYLLAVHFMAQSLILYCVLRPGYTRLRLRLYLVYFATAGLYFINNLQFTSTAFVAGQSGILLLMLAVRSTANGAFGRRKLALACVIALGLLVLSSLVRREVFYPVIGMAIPTCGLAALAGRKPVVGLMASLSVIVAAIGISAACWEFNYAHYNLDPRWRDFYEYNKLRVKFNDEAWVRYSPETAYLFQEVNWSENDFDMLSAWFFDNESRYSQEALRHVLEKYPWRESRISGEMFLKSALAVFLDRESLGLFLALPILLYCIERRALNYLVVGVALAMACVLIAYLILFSKTPPSRVYVPTLAFPLAVTACLAHGATFLPPERFRTWLRMVFSQPSGWRKALRIPLTKCLAAAVLAMMCLAIAKSTYGQYRRSRERIKVSNQLYDLLGSLDAADDKLYICWAATFPYEALRPLDNLQGMTDLHLLVLGWPQKTPLHQRMKDRFKIGDLAEAIYKRNDLYLIAHPHYLGLYEEYVREHFGVQLKYETQRYAKLFTVTQASNQRSGGPDMPQSALGQTDQPSDRRLATPNLLETKRMQ